MSDSQKFPVAVHALVYMAHRRATCAEAAVRSAELAASMPTNPVVVRRVTAMLGRAGLIEARPGANGGAWLKLPPEAIRLDAVLHAVHGCANLGCAPPGARGCPTSGKIPLAVTAVLNAASAAAAERLSMITVADLLAQVEAEPSPHQVSIGVNSPSVRHPGLSEAKRREPGDWTPSIDAAKRASSLPDPGASAGMTKVK